VGEVGEVMQRWIIQTTEDDVGTALADLKAGTTLADPGGLFQVHLQQDIPFGHKFALRNLVQGAPVHKYGQVIGSATQDIQAGQHVHVHNLESRRGRGDLVKELS